MKNCISRKKTNNGKIPLLLIVFIFTTTFLSTSCSSFRHEEDKTANEYIYETFQDWYLWNNKLPIVDPNTFETGQELIDSICVEQDRWSFAGSLTSVKQLFEAGEFTGFGGNMMLDAQKRIWVGLVYRNSPMGRIGVQRGWEIKSIDGFTTEYLEEINNALAKEQSVTFEFVDNNGETHTATLKREVVTMNTVLHSSIIEEGPHKIGYLVFDSFVETSEAELDSVFTRFNQEKITDLIVDLRYNGGGLNDIAYKLTAMIGGSKVKNKLITLTQHNSNHFNYNLEKIADYKGTSVEVPTVHFITTKETASASEVVINNLIPYMEVVIVGRATHGKPVGMYIFEVEKLDLAILPICFKTTNKDGNGDYFNGLQPTLEVADDITRPWGDPEEGMLKATIACIANPALATSAFPLKSQPISTLEPIKYQGINKLIGAY